MLQKVSFPVRILVPSLYFFEEKKFNKNVSYLCHRNITKAKDTETPSVPSLIGCALPLYLLKTFPNKAVSHPITRKDSFAGIDLSKVYDETESVKTKGKVSVVYIA